jgi:hypothetical protein
MAQVDIGTRQNRHQALADLSRMSSVVLRTVAAREGVSARYLDEENPALWDGHQPETYLHAVASGNGLRLDEHLNELLERPPFARLTGGTALTVPALPPGGINTKPSGGYTPIPQTPLALSRAKVRAPSPRLAGRIPGNRWDPPRLACSAKLRRAASPNRPVALVRYRHGRGPMDTPWGLSGLGGTGDRPPGKHQRWRRS